jgi:3-dehydroquinate synthase II
VTAPERRRRPWEVIPIENLVALGGRILLAVETAEEARLALGVLEKGGSGVVVTADSPGLVREIASLVKGAGEAFRLATATVESVRPAGMGDRVCVDTCTLMSEGQGLLIGNSSGFLFHVHAEVADNPYVSPRPFRVNAGPVHAYVRTPGGRTRYLAELRAGDPVLVVDAHGESEEAVVGRVKIEKRPLVLVTVALEGEKGSTLLQNAETIRLTAPDGSARSVVELEPGDPVLVYVEKAGRHFGMKVEETIREH